MKNLVFIASCLVGLVASATAPSVDFSQTVKPLDRAIHSSNTGYWLYPVRSGKESADASLLKSLKFAESRTDDWANTDKGQAIVDIANVFPVIHVDPANTNNYIFEQTDDILKLVNSSSFGSQKICYRLGTSDDNSAGHFNSAMPTNFSQVAEACAGIVRHYTSGWGYGPTGIVTNWEIWDAPDDATKNWYRSGLTDAQLRDQFAEFYATVLKRLRDEFGNTIVVGGPGLTSYKQDWFAAILSACAEKGVKPDYLSFRYFGSDVAAFKTQVANARAYLDANNASDVGLVLSAWHYSGSATSHSATAGYFTAKMLASLPNTAIERAYFYGCTATGTYSILTDDEKNVPPLKAFGSFASAGGTVVAAESSSTTDVSATIADDELSARLFVNDTATGTGSVSINLSGMRGVKSVSAVIVDSANDNASVSATYSNGVLTLPKKAGGNSAWCVTLTLPPPPPNITIGEMHGDRLTINFENVVGDFMLSVGYGATDAGTTPSDWQTFLPIGQIHPGDTSYEFTVPAGWGESIGAARFFVTELKDIPVAFLDGAVMDQSGSGTSKPQYFSTGFIATANTKCSVDWTPSVLETASVWLFYSKSSPAFEMYYQKDAHPGYAYGGSSYKTLTSWTISAGTRTTWILDGKGKKVGSGGSSATTSGTFSGTGGTIVIGRGSGNGVRGTIHGAKIWDNGTLVRDFVPAKVWIDTETLVAGFWDKVNGKFYKSSGSAAFVAGNEIDYSVSNVGNVIVLANSDAVVTQLPVPEQMPYVAKWRGNKAAAVTWTFDDGYVDGYNIVRPKLAEHGLHATFFIVNKFVGKSIVPGGSWTSSSGMSWSQISTLVAAGHDIGNHGYNHLSHDSNTQSQIYDDVHNNSVAIYNNTGYTPVSFAFPDRKVASFSTNVLEQCGIKYWVVNRTSLGKGKIETTAAMDQKVADAIASSNWVTFITHGVESGYTAWDSRTNLLNHIDHTAANPNVWIESMATVGLYEKLYNSTTVNVTKLASTNYQVTVSVVGITQQDYDGTLDFVDMEGGVHPFNPFDGNFNLINNQIVYPTEPPPAHEHTFGEWITDREPTAVVPGEKHRECSVCHYRDIASIPVVAPSSFTAAIRDTAGGKAVDTAFPSASVKRWLVAAWDTADRGTSTAAWANKTVLATVNAGDTSASNLAVPAQAEGYLRVFLVEAGATAADYVQDDLVMQFDAIENAGYGEHTASGNVWINLKDPTHSMTNSNNNFTFNENNVYLPTIASGKPSARLPDFVEATSNKTAEIVCRVGNEFMDYTSDPNKLGTVMTVCGDGYLTFRGAKSGVAADYRYWILASALCNTGTNARYHYYGSADSGSSNAYCNKSTITTATSYSYQISPEGNNTYLRVNNTSYMSSTSFPPTVASNSKFCYKATSTTAHSHNLSIGCTRGDTYTSSVRVYCRNLTAAERARNYLIDSIRYLGGTLDTLDDASIDFITVEDSVSSAFNLSGGQPSAKEVAPGTDQELSAATLADAEQEAADYEVVIEDSDAAAAGQAAVVKVAVVERDGRYYASVTIDETKIVSIDRTVGDFGGSLGEVAQSAAEDTVEVTLDPSNVTPGLYYSILSDAELDGGYLAEGPRVLATGLALTLQVPRPAGPRAFFKAKASLTAE